METINNAITAAQNLMASRQQIKALEEHEQTLQAKFAESIFADAIAQPSRVLRLDTYWRTTGLLPMDMMRMVNDALSGTENSDYKALYLMHHPIRRRYMEFDENGNPSGKIIERTEEVSIIVNLGAVKLPEGSDEKPVLGAISLVETAPLCKNKSCYYLRNNTQCSTAAEDRWKCRSNWATIQKLIDQILNQQ